MNWIVVVGDATDGDRQWDFRGAVLASADLDRIADWLDEVSAGQVDATGVDDEPTLTFTEPSLALSVASYVAGLVNLRIHLTHWFAPPWLDIDEVTSTYTFFVELALGVDEVSRAASEWRVQSAAVLR